MSTNNINNHFFEGQYKNIWRDIIPPALTKLENDFFMETSKLDSSSLVLDMMCGYGRHALGLARNGVHVTAVDLLPEYISEIKKIAEEENLPVKSIVYDVMEFSTNDNFDLVICMGNSLSFFDAAGMEALTKKIAGCLKNSGKFIFNSWMLAEIAIQQFKEKSWGEVNGVKMLADCKFNFNPTRIETDTTIISPEGEIEKKQAIDYIYSFSEVVKFFENENLFLQATYSILGKKAYQFGDKSIYFIFEKKA